MEPPKRGRGRPPKNKSVENISQPPPSNAGANFDVSFLTKQHATQPLPTHNQFSQLDDESLQDMDFQQDPKPPQGQQNLNKQATSQKIPPIVLKDVQLTTVKTVMNTLKITNYDFKFISIGIKIFVKTADDLMKLKAHLNEHNHPFFSYQDENNSLVKYVVYGLNTYTKDEMLSELAFTSQ
jgi:hypothetical protein